MDTERCCAKKLVLLPLQFCPEHRHPPFEAYAGKERHSGAIRGRVYLVLPGRPAEMPAAVPPPRAGERLTVSREVVLDPGDQVTMPPDALHWFQADDAGAVVGEPRPRATTRETTSPTRTYAGFLPTAVTFLALVAAISLDHTLGPTSTRPRPS